MPVIIDPTPDLFSSGASALVNPVNCVGVMGAGLAKQFARRWPAMLNDYKKRCAQRLLQPGKLDLHERHRYPDGTPVMIVNAPTKNHWRDPSRIEWVEGALVELAWRLPIWHQVDKPLGADTSAPMIAMPALGCGLGGLTFDQVRPLVEQHLGQWEEIDVLLYSPR